MLYTCNCIRNVWARVLGVEVAALDQLPSMHIPRDKSLWCLMSPLSFSVLYFISVCACYFLITFPGKLKPCRRMILLHTKLSRPWSETWNEGKWVALLVISSRAELVRLRRGMSDTQRCVKSQCAKIQLPSWLLTSWFTIKSHKVKYNIAVREAKLELGVYGIHSPHSNNLG